MPALSAVLLATALVCALVAAGAWPRRHADGGAPLLALLLGAAWWNAAYGMELAAGDVATKLLWAKAQYLGIAVVPTAALALALALTGRAGRLAGRRLAAVAVVPALFVLACWTNERHGLLWSTVAPPAPGSAGGLALEHGPVFLAVQAWSYGALFGATVLLVAGGVGPGRAYRRQSVAVLAAVAPPWAGNLVYLAGLSPGDLDLTTVSFALSAVVFALACRRFGLLDLTPVARAAVVDHLRDGVVVLDVRGRVVDCNPAAAVVLRVPPRDAIGRDAVDVLPAGLAGPDPVPLLATGPPADRRWIEAREVPLPAGRLLLLADVTEREALQAHLAAGALTDGLTGAGNRRLLDDRLQHALHTARRSGAHVAVLFLDLDDFKPVNDAHGHACGDLVLSTTARRITEVVRPGDTVARLGGDEFAVVLEDASWDAAGEVAGRLATAVAAPIAWGTSEVQVEASIGVALGRDEDAAELLHRADRRMYEHKSDRAGRH